MAQRLVRAKRKLTAQDVRVAVPDAEEWPERLSGVMAALYLVFTEGYAPTAGDQQVRPGLCEEALRLAERLTRLLPDEPEGIALVALMRLQHSRRDARTDPVGALVTLAEQDRSQWNQRDIRVGLDLTQRALRVGRTAGNQGPYQIQAAIAAVHAEASHSDDTDWPQIVALYGLLSAVAPSPVVQLNRAIAVAEAGRRGDGADAEVNAARDGLAILAPLKDELAGHHLYHAATAELLRRTGETRMAIAALRRAHQLARTTPARRYLTTQLEEFERPR